MTNTQTKVQSTVPIGGNLKMRIQEVDVTNYDDDSGGDGESFTPSDVNMRRFVYVNPLVQHGEGAATTVVNAEAQYDYSTQALRLLYGGTDGSGLSEVSSNANEGAKLRVVCIGV